MLFGIDLESIAQEVLRAAMAGGAEDAEAYAERTRVTWIRRVGGRTSDGARREEGVALRFVADGRGGFLAMPAAAMGQAEIRVGRAIAGAKAGAGVVLPAPPAAIPGAEEFALLDPALIAATLADRSEILRHEEEACRTAGRFARADFAYEDRVSETHLASTRGVRISTTAAKAGLSGAVIARADRAAIASGRVTTRRFADLASPRLGPLLAARATQVAGAGPAPAGRLTVVLPPDLAADLLTALAAALSADRVARKESFLAGRLGKRIGNDLLNVIDDGTLPGALGSAPADDEGTLTAYHHPIVGGRLAGWLSDATSAAALGSRSTGNAVRASFFAPPGIGPRNLILTPGCRTPAEIIADIEHGILVHESGRRAFDPASGRYALRVAGQLIAHGQPGRPVRGTIGGLLPEILMNLAALGHDLAFSGPIATPTVAIAGVSVTPAG